MMQCRSEEQSRVEQSSRRRRNKSRGSHPNLTRQILYRRGTWRMPPCGPPLILESDGEQQEDHALGKTLVRETGADQTGLVGTTLILQY